MKRIFVSVFLLLILFNCKKSNDSNTQTNYYFECTVDGKHLKATYDPTSTSVTMYSVIGTEIKTIVAVLSCITPGSYCFQQTMTIQDQTVGVYTPQQFVIETTEGANTYDYIASTIGPPCPPCTGKGNVTVKITTIDPPTATYKGLCKGEFSGTVVRTINSGTTDVSLSIEGSFELPIG